MDKIVWDKMWEDVVFSAEYTETEVKLIKQVSYLEARVNSISEKYVRILDLLKDSKEVHAAFNDSIQEQSVDISRLDEAYYHVFPERWAQDRKAEKQIAALSAKKTNPVASSTKA